jgi:uncharacterized membrane protein YbhN (UPF0104 family)
MSSTTDTSPDQFSPHRLRRRAIPVVGGITALVLIALLAPGLSDVRHHLSDAKPGWIVVGVVLEMLSTACWVLMFRPVFCKTMGWGRSAQIGLSEAGMGSIIPASGAGGLALGAWVLRRDGMPVERIARRSVAFFMIKSSVNFVAVAVVGFVTMLHLAGPDLPLTLTLLPALASLGVIALVIVIARLPEAADPPEHAGAFHRWLVAARRSITSGTAEGLALVRSGDVWLISGALGYWLFDNAVLWATYKAVGSSPAITIILMGYLIGQLGGLLPLPGGVGGIDGGLIGAMVVYGAPAAASVAAVLAYRLILFWVPLLMGIPAFASLWRRIRE